MLGDLTAGDVTHDPLPLLSSLQAESSQVCTCLSMNSMDPCKARREATEKSARGT